MKKKICKKCNEEKSINEFYKAGAVYFQSYCKPCSVKINRNWAVENQDKRYISVKKWRDKNKNSTILKSGQILDGMRSRSKKKCFDAPEFSRKEIANIINNGVCQISNIPFEFNQDKFSRSPWTPTPDRKDSSIGYTKENTQWVCYMFNVMKDEFSSKEIIKLLKALNKNINKIINGDF